MEKLLGMDFRDTLYMLKTKKNSWKSTTPRKTNFGTTEKNRKKTEKKIK